MKNMIYNENKSDFSNINISVPRGSVLVLYFLIYF